MKTDEELENMIKEQQGRSFDTFLEEMKDRWVLKQPKEWTFPKKSTNHNEEGITLYHHRDGEYFIPWNRIENPVDCLLFIHHLCEKIWINRLHVEYIITYAGLRFNWGYLGEKTPFQECMDQMEK